MIVQVRSLGVNRLAFSRNLYQATISRATRRTRAKRRGFSSDRIEQLEFGSSLKSPSGASISFSSGCLGTSSWRRSQSRSVLSLSLFLSDRSPAVSGGRSNNASGSFALSRYSASFAATQSFPGRGEGSRSK